MDEKSSSRMYLGNREKLAKYAINESQKDHMTLTKPQVTMLSPTDNQPFPAPASLKLIDDESIPEDKNFHRSIQQNYQ